MSWQKSNVDKEPLNKLLEGLKLLKVALEKERDDTIETAKLVMKHVKQEIKEKDKK